MKVLIAVIQSGDLSELPARRTMKSKVLTSPNLTPDLKELAVRDSSALDVILQI